MRHLEVYVARQSFTTSLKGQDLSIFKIRFVFMVISSIQGERLQFLARTCEISKCFSYGPCAKWPVFRGSFIFLGSIFFSDFKNKSEEKKSTPDIFLIVKTFQFCELCTFYFRVYLGQEWGLLLNEGILRTVILAMFNSKCPFEE